MKPIKVANGQQLVLDLVDQPPPDGRVMARVQLTHSDVQLARDETWWSGVRTGKLQPALEEYEFSVLPGRDTGGGLLNGFTVQLANGADTFRRHFTVSCLADVAQRKILEMARDDLTDVNATYKYYLTAVPAASDEAQLDDSMRARSVREPLMFKLACLRDFMADSCSLGGSSEPTVTPSMPVFVTEEAWEEGRQHAFRGGDDESAALFSGRLFRDTESSEVFVCFEACLEAQHAVENKHSVTFTGETWAHVRQLLQRRRSRLDRPSEIIVASVHRHPWLPAREANGDRTCASCPERQNCTRTTSVPSSDDFQWHRAVFAGQPWGTLLIWGYTARGEEDFRLYGLENGVFQQRPIRLLKGALAT